MRKLIGIALLAAGIGLPAAFFTIALPGMMRDGGASLMQVGLIYLVWLPSVLKWLWAPILERHTAIAAGRRRTTQGLALALGLCFLPVSVLAESMASGWLLALSVLSAALGLSIHLVIAGWCMASLGEAERARANGYIAAGMVLGGVLGGGATPWLALQLGWGPVIAAMAALIALSGGAGRLLQDAPAVPKRDASPVRLRDGLAVFSGRRGRLLLPGLVLIASTGAVDMTLSARLVDAGYGFEAAALILGSVATLLMAPASVLSGMAVARWKLRPCFGAICGLKALVLLALALPHGLSREGIAALAVAEFVLAAALTVVTWQLYMGQPAPGRAMTGFAALTSVDALLRLLLGIAAGALGAAIGMGALFAAVAVLNVLAALWVISLWQSPAPSGPHPGQSAVRIPSE